MADTKGVLQLEVVSANLNKQGDYRVKVRVASHRRGKTRIINNSSHPVWNHSFTLFLEQGDPVHAFICQKGPLGFLESKAIGEVDFSSLMQVSSTVRVRDLPVTFKGSSIGTIRVKTLYTPRGTDDPDTPEECLQNLVGGHAIKGKIFRLTPDHSTLHYYDAEHPEDSNPVMAMDIREIRAGAPPDSKPGDYSCTFNIIHGPKYEVWTLAADTEKDREIIVKGLNALMTKKAETESRRYQENHLWLLKVWYLIGAQKKGTLTLKDTNALLGKINMKVTGEDLREMFKQANVSEDSGDPELDFDEFEILMRSLMLRPEIKELFKQHAKDGKRMTIAEFRNFLTDVQKENVTEEEAAELVDKYQRQGNLAQLSLQTDSVAEDLSHKATTLNVAGFLAYLEGPANDAYEPAHQRLFQDMSQPLSHYWIDSSHNTYLLEDQLKGPSSVEAYIRALRLGCRCVELDCWDGGDGEPVVYHGHTLTKKILFKDCMVAVRDYAFEATDYPVILSIENHCSTDQQKKMAEHMVSILGETLYTTPPDEAMDRLPSPDYFKGKILVKGKTAPASSTPGAPGDNDDDDDIDSDNEDNDGVLGKPSSAGEGSLDLNSEKTQTGSSSDVSGSTNAARGSAGRQSSQEFSGGDGAKGSAVRKGSSSLLELAKLPHRSKEAGLESGASVKRSKKNKKELAVELANLVTHVQGVGFKSFEDSKARQKCYQMSSFAEKKTNKLAKENLREFLEYTERQLARVYPAGHRVDSSNYNPIPAYAAGCQIVALNYQTNDEGMQMLRSLFRTNGGCGYILKPEYMRQVPIPELPQGERSIKIKVISGNRLPKPKMSHKGEVVDSNIKVEIVEADPEVQYKYKTQVVMGNGFNPKYNEECTFSIPLAQWDIAVLMITARDDDVGKDQLIGYWGCPLRSLKKGYRHLPMHIADGFTILYSNVFVHIDY